MVSARADAECVERIEADARLDPVRDKLPIFITSPSMAQLANHTRPTKAEKRALLAYDEDRTFCESETGRNFTGETASGYGAFVVNSRKLRAQLYDGKIDFGTYVSTDSDNAQSFLASLRAKEAQAQAQAWAEAQSRADAAERESRQAAENRRVEQQRQVEYEALERQQRMQNSLNLMALGSRMMQASRPTPMPAPRMPVITNCQNNGYGATNCTSY
jgi:hypothetical protein